MNKLSALFLLLATFLNQSVHPDNAFSYELDGGVFSLQLRTEPGETYYIEDSINLRDWVLRRAESSEDPAMIRRHETAVSTESKRFFRASTRSLERTPPVITEFALSAGLFHTQTDGLHRLRYHIEIELWNPYKFGIELLPRADTRAYWIVVDGLPTVTVQLQKDNAGRSGASPFFQIDLSDFPSDYPNNTVLESLIWDWCPIDDLEIFSGEVYRTRTPPPQGLSRTIAARADSWAWHTVYDPIDPEKVIGPDDQVTISAEPAELTLYLIPFGANFSPGTHPLELGEPIVSYTKIPFEGFEMILAGDEYSRTSSSSYVSDEFNFGYHFKINELLELDELLPLLTPGTTVLDFSRDVFSNVLSITSDPSNLPALAPALFVAGDQFHDSHLNTHDAVNEPVVLLE
jgi:hypothetical protein